MITFQQEPSMSRWAKARHITQEPPCGTNYLMKWQKSTKQICLKRNSLHFTKANMFDCFIIQIGITLGQIDPSEGVLFKKKIVVRINFCGHHMVNSNSLKQSEFVKSIFPGIQCLLRLNHSEYFPSLSSINAEWRHKMIIIITFMCYHSLKTRGRHSASCVVTGGTMGLS